ncbi:MAG: HAMP domain-containing protein, partial [Treponema sp.]|nr:HAMP domain-containing protein [Treponema sp.]
MKSLRTTFFMFFSIFGFLVSFSIGIVMYVQYFRYIKYSYTDTLTKIAALTLKQYPVIANPEYLVTLGKAEAPEYWQLLDEMRVIVESFNLAYIYMVQKTPEGNYFFVFSSEDTSAEVFFEPYPEEEIPPELEEVYVTGQTLISKPYTDEWGSVVSLFTPVFDRNNRIAGVLGLDYDVTVVQGLEQQANIALILALVLEIFFSMVVAFLVAGSIIKPIKKLVNQGHAIAETRFDIDISTEREDEIGDMQHSLNTIRNALKKTLDDLKNEHQWQKDISDNLNASIQDSSRGLEVITNSMESVQGKT